MKLDCRHFRDALAHSLAGASADGADALRSLAWHEHLLACGDCRALLEEEEALEGLLATLPRPRLEPGLVQRVLARLADARAAEELDALLGRDRVEPAPSGLAGRVLAGLRAEADLDALLDRLPEPRPPVGLAGRVLARLESEREPVDVAPPGAGRLLSMGAFLKLAAAAALVLGGLFGWRSLQRPAGEGAGEDLAGLSKVEAPPADLLESLEVLESWELLTDESLDATLSSLDAVDVLLIELESDRDPLSKG